MLAKTQGLLSKGDLGGKTTSAQHLTASSFKHYSVLSDKWYTTGTTLVFSTVVVLSNSKTSLDSLKDIYGLWSNILMDILMGFIQRVESDCLNCLSHTFAFAEISTRSCCGVDLVELM